LAPPTTVTDAITHFPHTPRKKKEKERQDELGKTESPHQNPKIQS